MEISAPPLQPHQWRTATLVALAIAAVELVLLLVVLAAVFSHPSAARAKSAVPKRHVIPSRAEPKHPTLSRAQTKVLILNGNGIGGAAASEASRVRARGYRIAGTGNAAASYGQSVVLYRAGHRAEGRRLARDMGIAIVGPLDGVTTSQLHRAQLVIVLGR